MSKLLASDAYDLFVLLHEKYGKRFYADPFTAAMEGRIEGTLDSKKIVIVFADTYLIVDTTTNTREVLDELLPVLKEVMGNNEPICSYDLQSEDMEEKGSMSAIEWDLEDPEVRIKAIVNGRAYANCFKTTNIKLFGDRKVEDYAESEKEKEERINKVRIYGIDPGCVQDVEAVKNYSETDLFFAINYLASIIREIEHGRAGEIMSKANLTEEHYALEYLIYQTTKFGVELPEPAIDKHVTDTPSYRAWYYFYFNHFKNVLTAEEWEAFQEARKEGKDTSAFMPSGSWKDLLENTDKPANKSLK